MEEFQYADLNEISRLIQDLKLNIMGLVAKIDHLNKVIIRKNAHIEFLEKELDKQKKLLTDLHKSYSRNNFS